MRIAGVVVFSMVAVVARAQTDWPEGARIEARTTWAGGCTYLLP